MNTYAKLWYHHYLNRYLQGAKNWFGAKCSMIDVIGEARFNPIVPRRVVGWLWNFHTEDMVQSLKGDR